MRGHLHKVRLVRLEEPDQGGEERGVAGAPAQLIRPDSGQVEEPPGPPLVTERCSKRAERERLGVMRRVIW